MKEVVATLLLPLLYANAMSQGTPSGVSIKNVVFNNYSFVAPEGWLVRDSKDHMLLAQSDQGCIIIIFQPQPSSGNLETDAQNVFNQMYTGWQYRASGANQFIISSGHTPQGLEYCMMEAPMSKLSGDGFRYDGFEDGGALVIKADHQIVIIAARHTTMLAHSDCLNKYETWRRFFNTFTVKNVVAPKSTEEAPSKRIIGVWGLTDSGPAVGEYVFAANGNYQLSGALATSSKTTDYHYEYLHIKTYAFQGDGSYSMQGNQLFFKKRGEKNPETVQFRFEKVNYGGTGWKDRLSMLKTDPALGNKYEVHYEKKDR